MIIRCIFVCIYFTSFSSVPDKLNNKLCVLDASFGWLPEQNKIWEGDITAAITDG